MDPAKRPRVGSGVAIQLIVIGVLFVAAGVQHFIVPAYYIRIVPRWLPRADLLVAVSGVAEILGGIGIVAPATRRAAAWGLIALLVAVFPANVQMLSSAMDAGAAAWWIALLCLRLPLQGVLIWWIWRVGLRRSVDFKEQASQALSC